MENTYLYHSGIKEMRWGQRRWQNKDGSLTPAGKKRYAKMRAEKAKAAKAADKNKPKAVVKTKAEDKNKPKAEVKAKAKAKVEDKNKPKAVVKTKAENTENKPKELTPEEKKAKVLASRSAKEVYENRHLFDLKEMENTYKLLDYDKKIKDMIVREPNKVEQFFDNTVLPWAERINKLSKSASEGLGNIQSFIKKLDGDQSKEGASKKDKADEDKKDNKDNTDKDKKDKADKPKKDKADKDKKDNTDKPKTDKADKTDDISKDTTDGSKAGSTTANTYKDVYGKYYTSTKKASDAQVESVSGEVLDKVHSIGNTSSHTSERKTTTYYDVDYVDHTPSRQTTALVSTQSRTSVSSLSAPSSQAKSFVSGLLASSTSNRIQSLDSAGYTNAQIADKLGISTSTVTKYLNDTN